MESTGFSGILIAVKPKNAVIWLGLIWLGLVPALRADNEAGPFQSITDRNVFALRPPPPPPSNEPPPGPPPQLAKVILTGITSIFGPSDKRAFLEIEEPGKPAKKPILREGERNGNIEVLAIDLDKGIVKIRNTGFETNLVFGEQKSTPRPAAPPTVGAIVRTASTPVPPNPAPPTPLPAGVTTLPRRVPSSDAMPPVNNPGPTGVSITPVATPSVRTVTPARTPVPVPPLPR
jgi:hypothetical protein